MRHIGKDCILVAWSPRYQHGLRYEGGDLRLAPLMQYCVLRHGALMHDGRSARTARGPSRREVDDQGLPSSEESIPAETRQLWLESWVGIDRERVGDVRGSFMDCRAVRDL